MLIPKARMARTEPISLVGDDISPPGIQVVQPIIYYYYVVDCNQLH
jgi:hypothetical protein